MDTVTIFEPVPAPVSSSVTEIDTDVASDDVAVGLSSANRQSKLPSPVAAEKVTAPTRVPGPAGRGGDE